MRTGHGGLRARAIQLYDRQEKNCQRENSEQTRRPRSGRKVKQLSSERTGEEVHAVGASGYGNGSRGGGTGRQQRR